MASKAPPPLIRSSKAFSVEIPEGSNSAKSRRSDIVANDELDIHSKSSNFQSEDHHLGTGHGVHEDDLLNRGSAFKEDHAALANANVHDHSDDLKDRFASEQTDEAHAAQMVQEAHAHLENVAKLPSEDAHARAPDVGIAKDALKDRLADGDAAHEAGARGAGVAKEALKNNMQGVGNEAIKDNLQGVANEAIKDNLQGMANEALHDTQAGIAKEGLKDNLQGVGNDAIKDNLQGVANEAITDNLQDVGNEAIDDHHSGVAKESLKDNLQGIAQEAVDDHHAGVGKEALKDNLQGVGNEAINDHHAGVAKEALKDNVQAVAQEAEHDNKAGIAKEAIEDHHQGVGKEHLEDHIAQLPSTEQVLKDGPKPGVHQTEVTHGSHANDEHAGAVSKNKPKATGHQASSAEQTAAHAEALLHAQQEKAKKMEEFHGRVDAIRKTVSGINHKLDELDDEGVPIKR